LSLSVQTGGDPGPTSPLEALGWSARLEPLFAHHRARGRAPARVARVDRGGLLVATERGEARASVAPALIASAADGEALPATGDWVALTAPDATPGAPRAAVEILPRASTFRRYRDGGQVLAANVDVVFVAAAAESGATSAGRHRLAVQLDGRVRRLDRELALAFESGAQPVVVLSKADLVPDVGAVAEAVARAAPGIDVHATSGATGDGVDALRGCGRRPHARADRRLRRREVAHREPPARPRGARHLLPLRGGGGALIDTPGLRSLGLWDAEAAVARVYADVEALAAACRFRDCAHESEPGYAVRAAIEEGRLPASRLAGYRKLGREAELEERRRDPRAQAEEQRGLRARWRGYRARSRSSAKGRWRDDA